MPQTSVVYVEGLDALVRRLGKSSYIVKQEADDALEACAALLHRDVASYTQDNPPRRPGQTYVRTFTLARSFTHKVYRGRYMAEVGTNVRYGPYVMGEQQAWMHKGRWYTLKGRAEKLIPEFEGQFEIAGENIVRRLAYG